MQDEKPDSGKALADALVGCQIHLDAVAERVAQEAAVEEKPDGGPAFPEYENPNGLPMGTPRVKPIGGMSLRDWFAGQAPQWWVEYYFHLCRKVDDLPALDLLAKIQYKYADAMLKARGRKTDAKPQFKRLRCERCGCEIMPGPGIPMCNLCRTATGREPVTPT